MTRARDNRLSMLGALLRYPDGDYRQRLDDLSAMMAADSGDAARHVREFGAAIADLTFKELEELYTRTFDINPAAALEIGWHLFGEDYHRGALLVRLRQELRRHGIEESGELPDHLTHVLPLLDRMAPQEAESFAAACVAPAVEAMLAGLAGKANHYEHLLRGVAAVLQERFGAAIIVARTRSVDAASQADGTRSVPATFRSDAWRRS